MKTGAERVYAAGDCAEVDVGFTSLPMMYASSAETMGEVADINSAGGSARAGLSGVGYQSIFGLEVCHAGITLREARACGIEALEAVAAPGDDADARCSILFTPRDRAVLGVQIVGGRAALFAGEASLAVSSRATLDELAYHETPSIGAGSTDKSPLPKTARAGLSMVNK